MTQMPASATRIPATTSPRKSRYPGVSMRLMRTPFRTAWATARLIEIPCPVSSGVKSVSAFPFWTSPFRVVPPAT